MSVKTYTVRRQHEGDRFYREGEERELNEAEAKHLVDLGVLVEGKPEKADTKPVNKAEGAAPANKSAKA